MLFGRSWQSLVALGRFCARRTVQQRMASGQSESVEDYRPRDSADRLGRITIKARRKGSTLTTTDGLIAATALEHDLTLVTAT